MTKELVIFGVPVETMRDYLDDGSLVLYELQVLGGLTKTLGILEEEAKKSNFKVINAGEIPILDKDTREMISIEHLMEKGEELRKKYSGADNIIAVGHSHFGALMLYEDKDITARLDCHGDYFKETNPKVHSGYVGNGYASYMNAVQRRFKNVKVINYGVSRMAIYGEQGAVIDREYASANHFDIDIDVFDAKYRMNDSSLFSNYLPEEVLVMLREAKPRKIGLFEYREHTDSLGNALKFMKDVVKTVTD